MCCTDGTWGSNKGSHIHILGRPQVPNYMTVNKVVYLEAQHSFFFCLFYLSLLKGWGAVRHCMQIIPTYKDFRLLPNGVSVSLLPDLGKAGYLSSVLLLFREKERHPTHAHYGTAISQALRQRRTPSPPFFSGHVDCSVILTTK